jgi:hypothetical protein
MSGKILVEKKPAKILKWSGFLSGRAVRFELTTTGTPFRVVDFYYSMIFPPSVRVGIEPSSFS